MCIVSSRKSGFYWKNGSLIGDYKYSLLVFTKMLSVLGLY
jgi:hypothetical protein